MEQPEKLRPQSGSWPDIFAGQWRQMRGTLHTWWGKLTDDDWERIAGQKDRLLGFLQEKYGYTKDMAQREIERYFREYSSGSSGQETKATTEYTSFIDGIVNDAKDLLLHELTIAKLEIQSELHKTKEAAVSFAVGAGIAVAGGFLLLFMLVYLLAALTPIPLWGCYGVIGALLLGVGLVFLYRGKHTEEQLDEVLPQTTTTLKENAQWLKEQTTSNRA
jgi:uncharacterized protein YjbJ (UPF0337 family)